MNSHRHVAITDKELSQWAATRADDAGRLARELIQHRQQVVGLVTASREFWDSHNDLSEESAALDKALEPFSNQVPYADDTGTPSPQPNLGGAPEAELMRQKAISNARERNAALRAIKAALDDFELIVERINAGQINRACATAMQGAKEAKLALAATATEGSDHG